MDSPTIDTLIHEISERVDSLVACFDRADALFTRSQGLRLQVSQAETGFLPLKPNQGIVFRVRSNGQVFEAASSGTTGPELDQACQTLIDMTGTGGAIKKSTSRSTRARKDFSHTIESPVTTIPLEEKMDLCRKMTETAHKMDGRIKNATSIYKEEQKEEVYIGQGKCLTQLLSRVDTMMFMVLSDGTHSVQIWDGESLAGGFEQAGLDPSRIQKLVQDGIQLLGAPRLTPGTYDCLLSPAVAGMIAHEAFGHGTEADLFLRGRSRGQAYLGKQIASPLVSMIDHARHSPETTLFFFDHEGFEARPTSIIQKGILTQAISDQFSAEELQLPKTPNGRRESYDHKIYSRMTNTFFEPGPDTFDAMLASIEEGYIISHPTNGMEDPKQWGIQVEALMAEKIRFGKRTGECFSPVIITGYVPDLLQSISMASDTLTISTLGMCGKGTKEWVKVHDGGPWLKLKARLG